MPPAGGLKQPAHRQQTVGAMHKGSLVRQGKVTRTRARAACLASGPFFSTGGWPKRLNDVGRATWAARQARRPARSHREIVQEEKPGFVQTSPKGDEHHFLEVFGPVRRPKRKPSGQVRAGSGDNSHLLGRLWFVFNLVETFLKVSNTDVLATGDG